MQATIEVLGQLERRLNFSLPLQQIDVEMDNRLKRLARTVKMDGFRPGKVPLRLVAQQYGYQVRQEVLGEKLERSFSEAVREQNLRVAGYPRFDAVPAEGAPEMRFSATFEVYPEVPLADISDKELSRPTLEVSEAEVDKTLEILRKQRTTWRATDRAAQKDDRVTMDFVGKLNGEPFEGGTAEGFVTVIGQSALLADFEQQLPGVVAGESKSFDMTFPDDYHGKEVAGKSVTFEIKVTQVDEPVLPEIDADFARSLGVESGDVVEMRGEIRQNLEREVARRIKARVKDQAMRVLSEANQFELPKVLIDSEIQSLMESAREDLKKRGVRESDIQLPVDAFTEQAKTRVQLGLVIAELIRQENLKAKPEQIRKLVEEQAQNYEEPEHVVNWYYASAERLNTIEAMAVEDNVVEWVLSKVKIVDQPVQFEELMGNY